MEFFVGDGTNFVKIYLILRKLISNIFSLIIYLGIVLKSTFYIITTTSIGSKLFHILKQSSEVPTVVTQDVRNARYSGEMRKLMMDNFEIIKKSFFLYMYK